ncbi:MAG: hypothetical protein GX326_02425 [Clostridiaceae bacterium]|nr:hypothetical protein [Clostridiaceae bacterium]
MPIVKLQSAFLNGKVYTLGVSTLQDMIDDGVPFRERNIANAGEPTEIDECIGDGEHEYHMRKLMYMVDSEKYFGQSSYRFEFLNGELDYVAINLK